MLQSLGEYATAAQASQWKQQLTQVLAPAQAVLRSFGEAVAAVNSSDPGSLFKLEQLGKVAAYTTWLADPDAVASTFNGTVRPPAVPRSDIIKFAGAAALKTAPHSGAGWRQMADNGSGDCGVFGALKRTLMPVSANEAAIHCRFQCGFPLHTGTLGFAGQWVWSEVCGCVDAPLVNVSQGLMGTSIPQAGNPPSMLW